MQILRHRDSRIEGFTQLLAVCRVKGLVVVAATLAATAEGIVYAKSAYRRRRARTCVARRRRRSTGTVSRSGAAPALSSHAERPVSGRDSTSSAGCLRWRVQSRKRSGGVLTVRVSSSHRDRSNMWRLRGALLLLGTLLESTLGQRVGELCPVGIASMSSFSHVQESTGLRQISTRWLPSHGVDFE